MSNIKTIHDYIGIMSENKDETDKKQPSTTQKNQNHKSLFNEKSIIPPKLTTDEVSSLVTEYFAGLSKEELQKYVEKFRKEKVDGKTLVKACNDEKFMDKLKTKLDILLGDEDYFDNMIAMIRRREQELNSKSDNKEGANQSSEETDQGTSKGKVDTRNEGAFGTKLILAKKAKTTVEDVNVKQLGDTDKFICAVDVNGTDDTVTHIKNVNLTVDNTNADSKKRRLN